MIECKDLAFKYGKHIIFENFNYQFKDNTVIAITGASGKGKTTLIRCIAGLNKPYKGQTIYSHDKLNEVMPDIYKQFMEAAHTLEQHYKDMQDIEFTIEQGKLYLLQTRSGKRTTEAALRAAVEMAGEGLITKEECHRAIEYLWKEEKEIKKKLEKNNNIENVGHENKSINE
jgi:ABC-type cobalamin/Fe3+-siderophores transport system ATPase subunit